MRAPRRFRRGVRRRLSSPRRASANSNVGQPKTLTQGSTQSRRSPQNSNVGRSRSARTSASDATKRAAAAFAKRRSAASKSNRTSTQNSQAAKANRSMAKANTTRTKTIKPIKQTPKLISDPKRTPTTGKPRRPVRTVRQQVNPTVDPKRPTTRRPTRGSLSGSSTSRKSNLTADNSGAKSIKRSQLSSQEKAFADAMKKAAQERSAALKGSAADRYKKALEQGQRRRPVRAIRQQVNPKVDPIRKTTRGRRR